MHIEFRLAVKLRDEVQNRLGFGRTQNDNGSFERFF
jgi:hypothetical protein